MSNSEKHAFEKESLKDPFLSDALDGYSDNPNALSALKRMDQKRSGRSKTWVNISFGLFLIVGFLYYFSPASKSPAPAKKATALKENLKMAYNFRGYLDRSTSFQSFPKE